MARAVRNSIGQWWRLCVLLGIACVGGCSHSVADAPPPSEQASAVTGSPTPAALETSLHFDLVYPAGYDANRVAVGATDELTVGPRSHTSIGMGATVR